MGLKRINQKKEILFFFEKFLFVFEKIRDRTKREREKETNKNKDLRVQQI